MTIIDAWIQHPTPEFVQHPMFESLLRWMGVDGPDMGIEEFPIEFTVGALDAAGVDKAMLSAWYGADGELLSNDEVFAHCQAYPDRFLGVGSVNLSRPMEAVAEVRRCVEELGFVAIRQLPWLWRLPPDDRRFYPMYAACVDMNVPFCLQVGHTGPMMPSEFGRPIPYLDNVALEFPELTIVGGHIGYPWTDEMIAMATKYPNVYIDTSAYKPSRFPPQLVQFMKGHGRKKVLFGSNWPMISPADCLEQLDVLELDEEATSLFLGENARRVFQLD